ncbi:hypothetical protein KC326_g2398 [Hortaea werneckii]|nr:hypothetical protein KC326_g2398 [Hortaea werneckii]
MPPPTEQRRQRQHQQRDHGTSFSDLSYTTESPVEERNGGDVFHRLADRSHSPPSPSGSRRRAPGPGSYSSHRPWISIPDDRISSNPARETADSLSSGSTRSLEDSAQSAADSSAGWTGAHTERVSDDAGMAASRGEEVQNGANSGDKVDRALPDDDGMRTLREKLHEIRSLAISTEDKARKMHSLMTQDYLAHRAHYTNTSTHDADSLSHAPDHAPPKDPANPYNIRPGDLEPTYSPLPVYPNDINGDDEGRPEDDLSPLLGCAHYKRNVKPMPEDDNELEGLMPHIEDASHNEQDHTNGQTVPRRPREVYAGCNDCGRRSWTPFHWLGLKCQVCDSYNTNQMPPTAVQETEAERLIRQQQHHHRQHDFTGDSVLRAAGIGPDRTLSVNSTLDVPHSPAQRPIEVPPDPERRPSGAQSPRGRYFVQEDSQRRPSFSVPRFSAPSIPTLANLPEVPRLPRMPNLPNLELPRFSPAEMLDAVSRSLSPMRYYLQGLDMNEEEEGGGFQQQQQRSMRSGNAMRNFSPTSIRSDPTADASSAMRRASETDEEGNARGFWAGSSDGVVLSGDDDEDDDEDDTDDSVHAVRQDDDDDETSSSESEVSDTEMADEEPDDGDEEDEMALFGHR